MKSLFISIIVSVVFLSMMVGCKNRTDETFLNTIQKTRIYIPYKKMYIWDLKSAVSNLWGAFRIDMAGAVGVCAMEMTLALLAIRREYRRTASAGFFLMLSFFVYLTGVNLFFPTIMGSIESCGCFGELIHFSPLASFIKSAVLWMLSLVLLASTFKRNTPRNTGRLFRDKYLYVCIVTSLVLPLYSLWFFEVLSHTVYLIGYGVLCLLLAVCMYACMQAAELISVKAST